MKRITDKLIALLCALVISLTMSLGTVCAEEEPGLNKGDQIVFGRYPQTEIVDRSSNCGTYGKIWEASSDYIVNSSLYSSLKRAKWNSNGDTTVDGVKYHRLLKSEATNIDEKVWFYNWGSKTERYFRYDPIVWRVLDKNGSDLFVISVTALDNKPYNESQTAITWEQSTLREWLNGTFYNAAFSAEEKQAIETTTVINANNLDSGTEGGNDTQDKVFLLSEDEVYGPKAEQYGFANAYEADDRARQAGSSTYAKAMGAWACTDDLLYGNCYWWLRSPGNVSDCAGNISITGYTYKDGYVVTSNDISVRPAMHINLSSHSPDISQMKVTLLYDECEYTGMECTPPVMISGLIEGIDYDVSYSNNINAGIATVEIVGKGIYSGKITENFTIKKADISRIKAKLSSTEYKYSGKECKPAVSINGLTKGVDFVVSYKNNINVGKARAVITGIGNYQGSQNAYFKINPKGTSIRSVTKAKKAFTVKWKKQATQTTGYQVMYSTSSKFKSGNKTVTITKNSTTSKKITKLKSKKKYYVKVRTYKTVKGIKYYLGWSTVKSVTTK